LCACMGCRAFMRCRVQQRSPSNPAGPRTLQAVQEVLWWQQRTGEIRKAAPRQPGGLNYCRKMFQFDRMYI
jgi:hypothetical protein